MNVPAPSSAPPHCAYTLTVWWRHQARSLHPLVATQASWLTDADVVSLAPPGARSSAASITARARSRAAADSAPAVGQHHCGAIVLRAVRAPDEGLWPLRGPAPLRR